jgi:two-component system sensor histidine kinase CpxA
MKSIYAKVLAWSVVSFVVALCTLSAIFFSMEHRRTGPIYFIRQTLNLIGEDLCEAYTRGGGEELARRIHRLDDTYQAQHFVINSSGRDVARGTDHSRLIKDLAPIDGPPRAVGDQLVLLKNLPDPRFRLLILLPYSVDIPSILPYFGIVVLIIASLGYILAVHLVVPLRGLREVVVRFGGGELSARARSQRRDEIGELSRSFDEMADQIETLRTAEIRLLQDVSHELRSPLARIGFNLELARLGGDREATFMRLERDFSRLKDLVEQLLELTRAEVDPRALGLSSLALDQVAATVIDDCILEAEAKGCSISSHPQRQIMMLGDPELLRRAIENVLRNAIRHSPTNDTIDLSLDVHDGTAVLTIRDFGTGVPANALESIFEPFVRIDDDRSRATGGVGLGLAIARRAVMLHHGTIVAANAQPGLRVTIELPNALA